MSEDEDTQAYQVVMPRLGLTMTEASIIEWLVPDGSWVDKGTPLFTIENEKSTLDIESPASGVLQIQAPVGSVVPILKPVALLRGTGKVASYHLSASDHTSAGGNRTSAEKPQPAVTPAAPVEKETAIVRATPRARKMAQMQGIDLRQVEGHGVRGMARAEDITQFVRQRALQATPLARRIAKEKGISLKDISGSGPRGMITRVDVEKAAASLEANEQPVTSGEKIQRPAPADLQPLAGLRAVIAGRMSAGWRERPQVTLTTDADATFLAAARRQINEEFSQKGGDQAVKVSINAILVKLVTIAIQDFPYINVQLTEDGIRSMPEINIGVAVDTKRGLLVPVIRNTPEKGLLEINSELTDLVERALAGKSLPDDLTGGTFTITNLGMVDVDAFTPIINPPECAILGVGRIVARPVGVNGQIVLRDMVALSLSFDHRLVDGAPAGRFLQRIKQLIERPMVLAL